VKIKKKELRRLLREVIGPDHEFEFETNVYQVPPGVKELHVPRLMGLEANKLKAVQRARAEKLLREMRKG
jgi:hypothetical protein